MSYNSREVYNRDVFKNFTAERAKLRDMVESVRNDLNNVLQRLDDEHASDLSGSSFSLPACNEYGILQGKGTGLELQVGRYVMALRQVDQLRRHLLEEEVIANIQAAQPQV